MGILLLVLGFAGMAVGGIWLLIEGFKESALWGLGMLFVPLVSLFFLLSHWEEAKRPFFIQIAGLGLLIAGGLLNGRGEMGGP